MPLCDRLCAARLEREAEAVRAEGWTWVEIMSDASYEALRGYGRQQGKPQPLPVKQAKALAKVETTREKLAAKDELTDEEAERLEALDAEAAALAEAPLAWSERQKKRCGVVVSIGYDGGLELTRGLIAPADLKTAKAGSDSDESETGTANAEADPECAGLSNALREGSDGAAHRRATGNARRGRAVALIALAQALAVPLFYPGYAENPLDVRGVSASI